ncbi:Der1-like family-domain-containing protein [Piptocephalis cylindrospora]|uniref:Derlin n=1 Tax=Piptocephalis cylindrospora TaxID=1907219 RepID=A0A4P9Y7D6_9FUNG|nr:Der1-like family-domain-containing protein [Piptocephalis cylindrospora]|eukprot:RKP15036.1 Der1-like family-domain-containing protein [Piptocephalis cylindrospora]
MEQAVQTFREKYFEIPRITRTLLTLTAAVTLVPAVGLVSPYRMLLLWPRVYGNLEVWRLLTTFFLHGVNISLLFTGVFLHRYSMELETQTFQGRPADYAWFLLLTSGSSLAGSLALGLPVLSQSLLTSIITLWSRRAGNQIVQFYFGFQFEAQYLPWALVAFELLLSGSLPITQLLGIGSAFAYEWIRTQHARSNLLVAPGFLRRALPDEAAGTSAPGSTGFGTVFNARASSARGVAGSSGALGSGDRFSRTAASSSPSSSGHRWGKGEKLGTD